MYVFSVVPNAIRLNNSFLKHILLYVIIGQSNAWNYIESLCMSNSYKCRQRSTGGLSGESNTIGWSVMWLSKTVNNSLASPPVKQSMLSFDLQGGNTLEKVTVCWNCAKYVSVKVEFVLGGISCRLTGSCYREF